VVTTISSPVSSRSISENGPPKAPWRPTRALGRGSQSPPNPLENVPDPTGPGGGDGGGGGDDGGGTGGGDDGTASATTTVPGATTTTGRSAGVGRDGGADAVGGGSGDWRDAEPTSYEGDEPAPLDRASMVILLGMLAAPPLVGGLWRRRRATP
jgi:hypothetical protein